jgi:hypothetical protein
MESTRSFIGSQFGIQLRLTCNANVITIQVAKPPAKMMALENPNGSNKMEKGHEDVP